MNKLVELSKLGQSVWYDNIERKLLKSGELKRLIAEDAVSGVTSNPSIFEKAITSSTDYDEDIKALAHLRQGFGGQVKQNKSVDEIYEAITIKDIIATCDLLQDVYKKSNGTDGYVSIEVSPDYAYNMAKTLESARRIFKTINKPNLLIKVPGTREGFEATAHLISEGISVNVTLLFSQADYEGAAYAYIDGLKERVKKGMPLDNVFSVASVFISRIDSTIDKMIDERGKMKDGNLSSMSGKCAVANAKVIYQLYKKIFEGADFKALKGARPQKIVWASTSTKNPAYPATKYVDELIARETINTIPTATLFAFKTQGRVEVCIENNMDETANVLKTLTDNGIDLNKTCADIQRDGIKAFKESYDKALGAIKAKMTNA
ncbi:MAG: transaldolase [Planctomycetota bacterium]